MRRMRVRRRHIEGDTRPAGRFAAHRYGRGLIPPLLFRTLGTHCVDTAERVYALTYDDGPDPASTPGVLDRLAEHRAAATFFVLSEPARRHPGIVRRIVADGHELALHGDNHQSLLTMPPKEAARRLRDARACVEDIAGRPIALYRPPYGQYTRAHARRIRRLGLEIANWSADAHDWIDGPVEAIVQRALSGVFPGSILLLHDTRADPETLGPDERLPAFDRTEVLERILAATRAGGFREETAGVLMTAYPRVATIIAERMGR